MTCNTQKGEDRRLTSGDGRKSVETDLMNEMEDTMDSVWDIDDE